MPKKHIKPSDRLSRKVHLRLTDGDYEQLAAKVTQSGLNQSEYMREAVLANRTTIVARPRKSAYRQRILFVASKASNNLNQIARQANSAHLSGKLSQALFAALLLEMQHVQRLLGVAIKID